jgi:hypothetical protein
MGNTYILELGEIIDKRETALVGREHGEETLKLLKAKKIILKDIEGKFEHIVVEMPQKIITINKSFFLGLFETRIQELGKQKFEEKYIFNTSGHIKEKIKRHIEAAMLNATQGEILNDS